MYQSNVSSVQLRLAVTYLGLALPTHFLLSLVIVLFLLSSCKVLVPSWAFLLLLLLLLPPLLLQ